MDRFCFRGFHKDENGTETIYLDGEKIKGNWVYGFYWCNGCNNYFIKQLCEGNREELENYNEYKKITLEDFEVIPETVGQWSGLKNQYNQKIFEHDILREYSNEIADWEVSYKYGKFVGTCDHVCEDLYEIHDMDVIGNKFDKEVK